MTHYPERAELMNGKSGNFRNGQDIAPAEPPKPSPVKRETRTEVSLVPGLYEGVVRVWNDGDVTFIGYDTIRTSNKARAIAATLTEIAKAWEEMGK